jgi:hypothetical protein
MRFKLAAVLAAAAFVVLGSTAQGATFTHLQPGAKIADLKERVPVNVVFVGFEPNQVSASAFLAGLANRARPIVRSRLFYGNLEELGLDYRYDYHVTYTGTAWENQFFGALKGLAKPADRTDFQEMYNEQDGTRDVGQNHFIDAPTVEKWLIDHAPQGVNTRQDTIFFVNWWGRSDFIDHVYTKFGEPDPDTGYDFGKNRASRKLVAWGGTTPDDEETGLGASRGVNRIWFDDLSAGPEAWGGSYDVTNADLDGDGEADYRIPPAWEYAPGGYRAPGKLTADLGRVARYAAVNLLFTSSPLYPPYLTPELLPNQINLDVNVYEGWPGVNARAKYEKPNYLLHEEQELFPTPMSVDTQDLPFTGKARACYELWIAVQPCDPLRPQYPPDADLFLYNALTLNDALDQNVPAGPTRLYEAPVFDYATTEDLAPGFLGFADDNWVDGTQSFVFSFISQDVVDSGYGLTTTEIHELGHHFGMSHPHDGYDPTSGIDYDATGPFFFVWDADESNSMMSYIDLNWDFSQFDRDNAARHQAAGYITNANAIAGRILASSKAGNASAQLTAADAAVGRAQSAIAAHDYPRTWQEARAAYELVLQGANAAGVTVQPSYNGWAVLPRVKNKHEGRNSILSYGAFDKIGSGAHRSMH